MLAHVPSLAALEPGDDRRLAAELRLAHLRPQAAIVHALADQVERLSRVGDADGLGEQLIEEMTLLGCQLLEAASSLTRSSRREESGIFARPNLTDPEEP